MKPFTSATAFLLVVVAILHAVRLAHGWSVHVGGADIPAWASIAGVVLAGGLAIGLWREAQGQQAPVAAADGITEPALNHLLNMNVRIAMSAKVLNAAFPPGVSSDGEGRDRLRKFADDRGVKVGFAGGHSDTVSFERKDS